MNHPIVPCIWLDDQAKAAAEFYRSVFPETELTAQSSLVSEISISGQKLIFLDGGPRFKPNTSISFFVDCSDEHEAHRIWGELSADGKILMPLNAYPWSELYGWVEDMYGVSWQINIGSGEVTQTVIPCLLFSAEVYGKANAAIELYSSMFDDVKINALERFSASDKKEKEGNIKYAELSVNGQLLRLMETAADNGFRFDEGVSLTVYCDTQEEIDHYWYGFTANGEESMCGWLKDEFGVSWQIIPSVLGKLMSDPAKAPKAVEAFMRMRKFNIDELLTAVS